MELIYLIMGGYMKKIKYGFLCFVPTVLLILFWDSIPEKIATHFNFYGGADIFSSRWYIVFFVPFLGFLGHVLYITILEKKPEWIGRKGLRKYSFLYFPILTYFVIFFMLWNS